MPKMTKQVQLFFNQVYPWNSGLLLSDRS